MSEADLLRAQRDYVWSYFQLHATQRMTSFNFFLIISALLTTGLVGTFADGFEYHYVSLALGLGLLIISFVFWKIDERVRYLVKHAEEALKAIEERGVNISDSSRLEIALFQTEESETKRIRKLSTWNPCHWHLSYATCFRIVYLVFAVFALVSIVVSILRWTGT